MTNNNQPTENRAAADASEPELVPRLVMFTVALIIGVIVASSFGHGVSIYGYRMSQSVVKLEENAQQVEKGPGGLYQQKSGVDWVRVSTTDNPGVLGDSMASNTVPEFYYTFSFSPDQLTEYHEAFISYTPTIGSKCTQILVDGTPIYPDSETPEVGVTDHSPYCGYSVDFDDFFTWEFTRPEK